MTEPRLTHVDETGTARMVDVGEKPPTRRVARAEALVRVGPEVARAVAAGDAPKGDVLATARIAGIQGAKRAAELVPLAHPLSLDRVDVEAEVDSEQGVIVIRSEAAVTARTGVEIEAMTASAVAALAVYDMVKGMERGVAIERVQLVHKSGGRSGSWTRDE